MLYRVVFKQLPPSHVCRKQPEIQFYCDNLNFMVTVNSLSCHTAIIVRNFIIANDKRTLSLTLEPNI